MDNIDIELRKVIDAAIQSSINIDDVTSLKELYIAKRNSLKLSDRQIQKMLGMDPKTLNPILDGEAKQINFVNVIKLAHFLGISVNDLIKVYVPDLDSKQIGDIQRAREAGYIVEYFDVSILNKIKFFKSGSSSHEMSEKIKTFFNLNTLYSYSEDSLQSAFSRTKKNSNDLMRNFWVKSALVQFEVIANPNNYNRKELIDLIPKIRPHTRDVEYGLIKVLKALYLVGVTVIFQPSIEKLQVRGATMVVNKKPCIVLSDLQNNYSTLWFTLLHELHHVLYDIDEIEKRTYHISSGEGDIFLMNEEKAIKFKQRGLLIVLSGPSGVGKGTLCKEVLKEYPNLKLSVSVTTREPRPFEIEGKHYFFRTKGEFLDLIDQNKLIEYAKVFDSNYYGTPRGYVEDEIKRGNDVVLEIDVNGALQVKANFPEAILIFIAPPSFGELQTRLLHRGTEDEEKIRKRLGAAEHELLEIEKYDYLVINDWIDQAKRKIINIIRAEKYKIKNNKEFIYKITGRQEDVISTDRGTDEQVWKSI